MSDILGVDDDRERSPLHENRDTVLDMENRDRFKPRVRRSGVKQQGPLVGLHQGKILRPGQNLQRFGGYPGSSESSPAPVRKISAGGGEIVSPILIRKSSNPLSPPQRPSKLPLKPMYINNLKTSKAVLFPKKMTPPSSDQEVMSLSPTMSSKFSKMPSKRAASPSRTTCKRSGHSSPRRREISRVASSPKITTRRRSPSLNRSRPPSPGGPGSRPASPRGPARRNPSPSQLDPEQAEKLRSRLGKARKIKLYLLQQSGSNSFLVADSTGQKYKVNIGPQICSCGKGPGCLHLLFIMLRVFKIKENDSRLTARELKEFEIDALFRDFEQRKKSRVMRSRQQSMENLKSHDVVKEEDDALCPICQDEITETCDKLSTCSNCQNHLHQHCMKMWMETPGENIFCPLCRAPWAGVTTFTGDSQQQPHQPRSNCYQYYAPSPYQAPSSRPRPNNLTNNSNASMATSSGYSTISRTSDTIHMIEQGGSPEDIPLPKAEQIPQHHWSTAQHWITHYGRDLVACLLSRDWVNREIGLRRLARELVKILKNANMTGDYTERTERAWKCCAEMLATMIEDKVYKVYHAAVKTTRALLNFLSCRDDLQLSQIKSQLRPIIQSILIKCADGNRRISELSTETLVQLARGQEGEFALGDHAICSYQLGLGGPDFVLNIVLEERDLQSVSWQWIMGRLVLLETMIQHCPDDFSLDHKNKHLNHNRLMRVIYFTFPNLGSSHVNVNKTASKVFILAARNTASDDITFSQVMELLGALDQTLEMRLRRKLTVAIEEHYTGENQHFSSCSTVSSIDERYNSTQEHDRRAFLEEFLKDCSNKHTEPCPPVLLKSGSRKNTYRPPLMRSTSHSPSRQISFSRCSSQSPSRVAAIKHQLKKQQPFSHSALNINQENLEKQQRPVISSKPRSTQPINRLKSKFKPQENKREVLPNYDLSFSSVDSRQNTVSSQMDSWVLTSTNDFKPTVSLTRGKSRDLPNVMSPHFQRKWTPSSPTPYRSPQASPSLGRDKRSDSCKENCKENFDYEESLALAMALSRSIYQSPLPVIPGLSHVKSTHDVLAHPHTNMTEEGDFQTREYSEGVDWTKATVLGTGAYSTCYQARDVETGTLMAAKQISFCRNSDEEQDRVETLIREEVLLISKLQHPHIVRMYGAIQEGTHINVFVEWMAGGSISSLLDKHGLFTESVIVRYLHQILLGLDYLHSNGILHRDLKGANLLVDTSGHHLRIADFGAAARMMSKSTVPGEFQGQLQGTIAFMAPEVLRGDSYGRSCDIWSLGCSIIEMATGKPPWGASDVSNHLALIFRIACATGPPEVPCTLSPGLRDLTLRCLELDPNLRPSARELLLHPVFQDIQ